MKMMIPRVRSNPADEGALDVAVEVVDVPLAPIVPKKKGKKMKLPEGVSPTGIGMVVLLGLAGVGAVVVLGRMGFGEEKAISMAKAHVKSGLWRQSNPTLHRPYSEYVAWANATKKPAFSATTADDGKTFKVRVRHAVFPVTLFVTKDGVSSSI